VLFIRAQSAIRADGTPAAHEGPPQFELPECMRVTSTSKHCALRAPTMFSARMKSTSVQKTWLWIKAAFLQDRRLCADVLFIRAQSAIRADGTPAAQSIATR